MGLAPRGAAGPRAGAGSSTEGCGAGGWDGAGPGPGPPPAAPLGPGACRARSALVLPTVPLSAGWEEASAPRAGGSGGRRRRQRGRFTVSSVFLAALDAPSRAVTVTGLLPFPRVQVSTTNPTMRRTSGSSRRPWRPSRCPSAARKGLGPGVPQSSPPRAHRPLPEPSPLLHSPPPPAPPRPRQTARLPLPRADLSPDTNGVTARPPYC